MLSTDEMRKLADNVWLSDQGQLGRDIRKALHDAADELDLIRQVHPNDHWG